MPPPQPSPSLRWRNATELSRIRPGLGIEEGDDLVIASDPSLAGQTLPASVLVGPCEIADGMLHLKGHEGVAIA